MGARLYPANFYRFDALVIEDFQALTTGVITSIPQVVGSGGCILEEGAFVPREMT